MRNKFLARSLEATGSISGAIGVTWGTFFLLGGMPLLVAVAWVYVSDPEAAKSYLESPLEFERLGMHRMVFFVLMMLNFVIAMAGLWAGARWIAKQRFFTLISGLDKVRWTRMLGGMLVWLALMAAYSFIQYLISPNSFQNSADAHEVVWWVLPGICLIPIQSAFEELAVRGQLMQAISRRNPANPLVPLLLTSVIFAMLHGLNTEIGTYGFVPMMLQYLLFGLFLGAFALMDEGLELPIGIHIGNNLFSLFFLSYEGSSLDTPSLWRQTTSSPTNDIFGIILMFFLVFLIYFGRKPHLLRNLLPQQEK